MGRGKLVGLAAAAGMLLSLAVAIPATADNDYDDYYMGPGVEGDCTGGWGPPEACGPAPTTSKPKPTPTKKSGKKSTPTPTEDDGMIPPDCTWEGDFGTVVGECDEEPTAKPTTKPTPKPTKKPTPTPTKSSGNDVSAAEKAACKGLPTTSKAYGGSKPRANCLLAAENTKLSSDQFSCLVKLWTKESGWNHRADNRTSEAYGIPQSNPGSKMKSAGKDYLDSPETQIEWGIGYIKDRYRTPCGAWGHSQSVGWY